MGPTAATVAAVLHLSARVHVHWWCRNKKSIHKYAIAFIHWLPKDPTASHLFFFFFADDVQPPHLVSVYVISISFVVDDAARAHSRFFFAAAHLLLRNVSYTMMRAQTRKIKGLPSIKMRFRAPSVSLQLVPTLREDSSILSIFERRWATTTTTPAAAAVSEHLSHSHKETAVVLVLWLHRRLDEWVERGRGVGARFSLCILFLLLPHSSLGTAAREKGAIMIMDSVATPFRSLIDCQKRTRETKKKKNFCCCCCVWPDSCYSRIWKEKRQRRLNCWCYINNLKKKTYSSSSSSVSRDYRKSNNGKHMADAQTHY